MENGKKEAYELLGLDLGATMDDVKKAYRELSEKNDPKKGGSVALLKLINQAYKAITGEEGSFQIPLFVGPAQPQDRDVPRRV